MYECSLVWGAAEEHACVCCALLCLSHSVSLAASPSPVPSKLQGLGNYISGAILFEETLYQSGSNGKRMTDMLVENNIVPGIKVDKGLAPLANSNK